MEMQKIREYLIENSPISSGVFSKVFRGYDLVHKREVAIKKSDSVSLAQSEMQVMTAYGVHPHLPRLYDFFVHDNTAYVVMELVKGPVISKSHLSGKRYPVNFALIVTLQILDGLRCLHQSGFLHLDLQPLNILFSDYNRTSIKILDFGCSVQKNISGIWEGHPVGGTWEYMAPEQFENPCRLDDTADLYAAAGICVFMLTGKAPFLPSDIHDPNYRSICLELHQRLPELNLNHALLKSILLKALHPNREERYPDAESLIADLRGCL